MNGILGRSVKAIILIIVFALLLASASLADQVIQLRSGEGFYTDYSVTMLVGSPTSEFAAFTPQDFQAAREGVPAYVLAKRNMSWINGLSMDSSAWWISTDPLGQVQGSSALYAIDFLVTDRAIDSAELRMFYSVDNKLGGMNNDCIYINEMPLLSNTGGIGNFVYPYPCHRDDISPMLRSGLNTMYFNTTNLDGATGLIFTATITIRGSEVPEPAGLAFLSTGVLGLFGLSRRRAG